MCACFLRALPWEQRSRSKLKRSGWSGVRNRIDGSLDKNVVQFLSKLKQFSENQRVFPESHAETAAKDCRKDGCLTSWMLRGLAAPPVCFHSLAFLDSGL